MCKELGGGERCSLMPGTKHRQLIYTNALTADGNRPGHSLGDQGSVWRQLHYYQIIRQEDKDKQTFNINNKSNKQNLNSL